MGTTRLFHVVFDVRVLDLNLPLVSALAIGPWRQHFDDESWRGSVKAKIRYYKDVPLDVFP
jgi:hypothetical protein